MLTRNQPKSHRVARLVSGLIAFALVGIMYMGSELSQTATAAPVVSLSSNVAATVVNVTSTLNVRNGPSLGNAVIGSLKNGAKLTVTGYTSDGWLQMSSTGISKGYVSAQYVKVPVAAVSLPASGQVSAGQSTQLKATITPACATNHVVTWTSSNSAVATVSSTGVVTGKAVGTVNISARTADGGKTAVSTIAVKAASGVQTDVTGVTISQGQPLMSGRTEQLSATVQPSNATNKAVTWSSSSTSLASVSASGLVTGKISGTGKSGTVTVTVKTASGGHSAATHFVVYSRQDVQAKLNALACKGADGKVLTVDGQIGANSTAAIKAFQKAAKLSADGVAGPATLTAMFASSPTKCGATSTPSTPPPPTEEKPVVPPTAVSVTGVSLSKGQPMMSGRTQQLTGTIAPANATNQGMTWSSSNTATATVSATGQVTGKVGGTGKSTSVTIMVKTVDGAKSATTSFLVYSVQDVQTRLNALSCPGADGKKLTVDGTAGTNSKFAIQQFQLAAMLSADGVAGPLTLTALFDAAAPKCAPVSTTPLNLTGFAYKWSGPYVTQAFLDKVLSVANQLSANPDDLMAVMAAESGINPYAVNAGSGATGLIQFMPSTATGLGTSSAALLKMNAVDQLDYVYKYLARFTGKLKTISDVCVAVLWPAAVGQPDSYVLFSQGSSAYAANSGLDTNKDGNVTIGEAAQRLIDVRNRYGLIV